MIGMFFPSRKKAISPVIGTILMINIMIVMFLIILAGFVPSISLTQSRANIWFNSQKQSGLERIDIEMIYFNQTAPKTIDVYVRNVGEIDVEIDNIVSIPKSMIVGIQKEGEILSIPEETLQEIKQSDQSKFKLYEGEVPPIPLEEYTPMDVDEHATQETEHQEMAVQENLPEVKAGELPSLDALAPPDFDEQLAASE